ncbi:hypothetical protein M404DRAFT_843058 [Pisolithus tinctorius Marx 270]|uniref:Uncharacterized protein n=1 Tax=Pisolithus tinctorius Marx 270 TaxID=870435 RepID=A0A0C3PCA9_PISTI|nr:hypothetical protein M404DRAFT_843058 [Pisolithus tinctorius Marx 270]
MGWYGKEELNNILLTNITLNETPIASVANVDNFTFAYVPSPLITNVDDHPLFMIFRLHRRVFGAGHAVVSTCSSHGFASRRVTRNCSPSSRQLLR